jgi:hypothetical protein
VFKLQKTEISKDCCNISQTSGRLIAAWGIEWVKQINDEMNTAVTIEKGADSKQNELYGWKASSRNLKHLEQLQH